MTRTLLAEELRTLGTVHAKTVAVLLIIGAGALAVGLVPHALGADVVTLMTTVGALVAFVLPVPVVLVHGLTEYWQSVHGPRGYLTMSLPARGREVLTAKVLYLLTATLSAFVITVAGLALVVLAHSWMDGVSPVQVWDRALALLHLVGPTEVWTVLGAALVQVGCSVVIGASVMSIAAQTRWGHLGVAGAVIGLLLAYLACQLLYSAAMILLPIGIDLRTGLIVTRSMLSELLSGVEPTVLGLGFLPAAIVLTAALVWWAVHCLEHHASLR